MKVEHEHEWVVFSTALAECWLMLECAGCGASGIVPDPTREEWAKAFHAPPSPYRWCDNNRVVVKSELPCGGYRHVTRTGSSSKPSKAWKQRQSQARKKHPTQRTCFQTSESSPDEAGDQSIFVVLYGDWADELEYLTPFVAACRAEAEKIACEFLKFSILPDADDWPGTARIRQHLDAGEFAAAVSAWEDEPHPDWLLQIRECSLHSGR